MLGMGLDSIYWALSQYKDWLSRYGYSHYKDKRASWLSNLYNGDTYIGKAASLYWDSPRCHHVVVGMSIMRARLRLWPSFCFHMEKFRKVTVQLPTTTGSGKPKSWKGSGIVLNSWAPGRFEKKKVISNFQFKFSAWWLSYLLWKCPQMNAAGTYWW